MKQRLTPSRLLLAGLLAGLVVRAKAPDRLLWGEPDADLQRQVTEVLSANPMLGKAHAENRVSVALVDLSDPNDIAYALVRPDWEVFTASMSKIAVLLGVVSKGGYEPVRSRMDDMIKRSDNDQTNWLYWWAGHDAITSALYAHDLYDDATGGLWWTPTYRSTPNSPKSGLMICGTARQAARYLLLMEQGRLIDSESSKVIKDVLRNSGLAVLFPGIREIDKSARYYGKPGVYEGYVSEAMLVESGAMRYILVVITKGTVYKHPDFYAFGAAVHRLISSRNRNRTGRTGK